LKIPITKPNSKSKLKVNLKGIEEEEDGNSYERR
jgi:hypothetical protein